MIGTLTKEQIEFYYGQTGPAGELSKPEYRKLRIAVVKSQLNEALRIENAESLKLALSQMFSRHGILYALAMAELLVEYEGEMFDRVLAALLQEGVDYCAFLAVALAYPKLGEDKRKKLVDTNWNHKLPTGEERLIRGYLALKVASGCFQPFNAWIDLYLDEIKAKIRYRTWGQESVRYTVIEAYHENPAYAEGIIEIIKLLGMDENPSTIKPYVELLLELSELACTIKSEIDQHLKNAGAFYEASLDLCQRLDVLRNINDPLWQMKALPRLNIPKKEAAIFFRKHIVSSCNNDNDIFSYDFASEIDVLIGEIAAPESFEELGKTVEDIFGGSKDLSRGSTWKSILLTLAAAALKYWDQMERCDVFPILYYAGYYDFDCDDLKQLAKKFGAEMKPSELAEFRSPIEKENYEVLCGNLFTDMTEASFVGHALEDDKVEEVVGLIHHFIFDENFFSCNDNLKAAYEKYNAIRKQREEWGNKLFELQQTLDLLAS